MAPVYIKFIKLSNGVKIMDLSHPHVNVSVVFADQW